MRAESLLNLNFLAVLCLILAGCHASQRPLLDQEEGAFFRRFSGNPENRFSRELSLSVVQRSTDEFSFTLLNKGSNSIEFCVGPTQFIFFGTAGIKSGPVPTTDRYFCNERIVLESQDRFSWNKKVECSLSAPGPGEFLTKTIIIDPDECHESYGCHYDSMEHTLGIEVEQKR